MERGAVVSMVAMALGIGIVSVLVVRWITRPLRRLADAADGIGHDLAARPLATEGPVEVRHAALAFNAMQGRIRRLVEDRTEALAAVSHDLRTPLARLRLRAGFLPEGEDRARMEADIAEMEAMVARTLDYIREGRDGEPVVPTDLAAILLTLASDASDAGHDVIYDGPARAVLPLRRVAAKRAFSNLVDNAVRHGAPPVRLTVQIERDALVVDVSDGGPGIAPDDRARALAPFQQLDMARGAGGSGLGLSIAQRFAEASGGTIELGHADQGGLAVRIALPRQQGVGR
jgi:signal transduction histidine kinase